MEKRYEFDERGRFVIRDYNRTKPFASFLPGIAGIRGKPMWAYYVNRGQGIASFGVQDKDGAVMEFYPADKSYRFVPTNGFRTFIKANGELFEPFAYRSSREQDVTEKMMISPNMLELESVHRGLGIAVHVAYYTLPNESFAALVRRVGIRNLGPTAKQVELLDGLPAILPYGIRNSEYKEIGNTLKSWMDVYNMDRGIPFYRLRASTADSVEVSEIAGGHFYASFAGEAGKERLLAPIVDPGLVFGYNSSLDVPDAFAQRPLEELFAAEQTTANQVPCGFSGVERRLEPGGRIDMCTMIGHVSDIGILNGRIGDLARFAYVEAKREEARALAEQLTEAVATRTSMPAFDAYCKQNALDNILRGGQPIMLENGGEPFVYHLYSRKHGDLERDYNFFSLDSSYYSQGNGNFRDMNQNRRSDVLFHPEIGDFNIRMFMSFMQTDGYNPLVIKGCSFRAKDAAALANFADPQHRAALGEFMRKPYTPGKLLAFLEDSAISLSVSADEFLSRALSVSEQSFEADYGEGYWIDHWTYNLDLVENYLAVYPDRLEDLLFRRRDYTYYDSPAVVLSRERKTVLADGKVRQFGAVRRDEEKERMIRERDRMPQWMRTRHGQGEIYRTYLYEKLLSLALIKFVTQDPEGVGIEMEAGKPGWNDSLNGLPGLFASGFSELCELHRLLAFLLDAERVGPETIDLPVETADLLAEAASLAERFASAPEEGRDFEFWDRAAAARERYRERVRFGFEGTMARLSKREAEAALRKCLNKVKHGIGKALRIGGGVYPTYFYYEATGFEPIPGGNGEAAANAKGQPYVRATGFRRVDMPYFLEGPMRAMKMIDSQEERLALYRNIKETELYDRKLKMYKVNASLANEPHEIGRARAFTPGWLENESVFMHMEYKYLLELLKGGLYEAFFEEMKNAMPPFLDAETYGRNPLENSSFIASSANPDPKLHGTGFVARLSGSTAEFLSMWNTMMWGERPFRVEDGRLRLRLEPALPAWLFADDDTVRATFLGCCDVVYHNPRRLDTFGADGAAIERLEITMPSGEIERIDCGDIDEPIALLVREKRVRRIEAFMQ
ncbi:hypothetical protein PAE9249_00392 [Paenibacillus sp. CECT 9249]|uniref:cellobiose phosphorylase n=1 Tax=Paenibacillus sp. CECT 9249 TaxID=2845385 RepID=UPI001E33A85C|nr:cellobiose phosphorylase [Paenibacillus sp. CECT 9249]CAH0117927.1 hypothetical protein PAE9249_00392 [Paenibacillus sp. CECT 9249]